MCSNKYIERDKVIENILVKKEKRNNLHICSISTQSKMHLTNKMEINRVPRVVKQQ